MAQLSVNIDHVATVRQARRAAEPDPVRAAHEVELGGAAGVTVHLREDRRHIQDDDVERLRALVGVRFNLEMAATREMVAVATRIKPHTVMLVPEGRDEVTTEGGLDVVGMRDRLRDVVMQLKGAGAVVSAFIDAADAQVDASAELGFDVCEVHTGPYAIAHALRGGDFLREDLASELELVRVAGARIVDAGLRFNAGHGLNYHNVEPIASLPGVQELHIGHAIVSRAVYIGLREATREMVGLLRAASSRG